MAVGAKGDVQNFLRANPDMWQFAFKAKDDYLFCRLGMLSGYWSSFEMATQAAEKLLKAYLLLKHPGCKGDVKKMLALVSKEATARGTQKEKGHDVEACLALAAVAGLTAASTIQKEVERINDYYARRYPGDPNAPTTLSTREIEDVDRAMFAIWDAFKAENEDFYYTTGIGSPAYEWVVQPSDRALQGLRVFGAQNKAYAQRRADLEQGIHARIQAWYPAHAVPPLPSF